MKITLGLKTKQKAKQTLMKHVNIAAISKTILTDNMKYLFSVVIESYIIVFRGLVAFYLTTPDRRFIV